ncbi:MAG TPA: hypothetical protein RMH99_14670 [Sandaracinaceae bacterium LLY-WYZ-13_1]|nr:hypothetical protein [Sandaracinaceae bacterium LLY-WYZ-13_1]
MNTLASTSGPPTGPSLIVEEALATVLSPVRLDEVVSEALGMAGLHEIPERPVSLRVFVEGALFATLARHLEVSDALELVGQIRAALELALDAAPPTRPHSDVRTRLNLPPTPNRVLVVTQASLVVFLLQDVVGEDLDVVPLSDEASLRDRIRRFGGEALLVVVDRRHPCVGPGVSELLADELGSESTVIWWGAHGAETEDVSRRLRGGPRLIGCEFDLELADLGRLCRSLLDD